MASAHTQPDYPETQWALVRQVQQATPDDRPHFVAEFLRPYYGPIRRWLELSPYIKAQDAEDLFQSFIVKIIREGHLIDRLDQTKGNARAYLHIALVNHVRTFLRNTDPAVSFSTLKEYAPISRRRSVADPGAQFDLGGLRALLDDALAASRKEFEEAGHWYIWEFVQARILMPGTPEPFDSILKRLGLNITPEKASNLLTTGKRTIKRNITVLVAGGSKAESVIAARIEELCESAFAIGMLERGESE